MKFVLVNHPRDPEPVQVRRLPPRLPSCLADPPVDHIGSVLGESAELLGVFVTGRLEDAEWYLNENARCLEELANDAAPEDKVRLKSVRALMVVAAASPLSD